MQHIGSLTLCNHNSMFTVHQTCGSMHKKYQLFKHLRLGGVTTTNAARTTKYEIENSAGKPQLYRLHLFHFSQVFDPHSSWSNSASQTVLQTGPTCMFNPTESLSESRDSSSYITAVTWNIQVTISQRGKEPNNSSQTGASGGAVSLGTAGSTEIFQGHNPSGCTMALGLTQPLTEREPVYRADNLTTFVWWPSLNLGALTSWNPLGLSEPVQQWHTQEFCLVGGSRNSVEDRENRHLGGSSSLVKGFCSICKSVKHRTGNSAQLYQSFGIQGVGGLTPTPRYTLLYRDCFNFTLTFQTVIRWFTYINITIKLYLILYLSIHLRLSSMTVFLRIFLKC
jgi:hypothetical protein